MSTGSTYIALAERVSQDQKSRMLQHMIGNEYEAEVQRLLRMSPHGQPSCAEGCGDFNGATP